MRGLNENLEDLDFLGVGLTKSTQSYNILRSKSEKWRIDEHKTDIRGDGCIGVFNGGH